MKKLVGIFIVVFFSIGIADVINGVILTFIYTPNTYSIGSIKMANYLQYTISAITVTIVLWILYKVKSILKNAKSSVKAS